MKLYTIAALLLSCVCMLLFCVSPTDPMQNYDNATSTPLLPDGTELSVGDTVHLELELKLPHLADYVVVSINGKDTTIICRYDPGLRDTIRIRKLFSKPDTVHVHYQTVFKNGSEERDSSMVVIHGLPVKIIKQPGPLRYISENAACTLIVAAQGSEPMEYQWYKGEEKITEGSKDTLILTSFSVSDTGIYKCLVLNGWGSDTSDAAVVLLKPSTGKNLFWNFTEYSDSVPEGDSLTVEIRELYTKPSGASVEIVALDMEEQCRFIGDSAFLFRAGQIDSGLYEIPVVVSFGDESDTAVIKITVLPAFYSLTITSEFGNVSVVPERESYRRGDTVQLEAVPESGYLFYEWDGDAAGSDSVITLIIESNTTITARFWPVSNAGCDLVESGGSINQEIRASAPAAQRPKLLCPQAGMYEEGTVKVHGKVRFVIQ